MSKKKYRGPRITGQWVPHPVMMLGVLRGLSLSARRILDTLEVENCRHAGRENGRLAVSYTQFERFMQRSCIRLALDELVAAGLIQITQVGGRAYAELRRASLYRLTYLHTFKDGQSIPPTHDWKKQKARPESTTGARPESTTGNGQKPDRIPPPQGGQSQTGIHHSFLYLGEAGGGEAADLSSLSCPPTPSAGTGPSAPSPILTAPSTGRLQ